GGGGGVERGGGVPWPTRLAPRGPPRDRGRRAGGNHGSQLGVSAPPVCPGMRAREGGARVGWLALVQRAPAGIGGQPIHDPALGSRTGGNRRSISARLGSSQGGSLSAVPRRSAASSAANPGGSGAISNKNPPGSRKKIERKYWRPETRVD